MPRTIAIAASKGGVGKSTLTAALAVQAVKDGAIVAIHDWEPQGSLTFWWKARGAPDQPFLVRDAEDPQEIADWNHPADCQWIFLDTAPCGLDHIERAIMAADFVLIPTHASAIDIAAIRPLVSVCKEHTKPFAFVLTEVEPNSKKLTDSAVEFLGKMGPVLKEHIQNRKAYVTAINRNGKTAAEIDKDARAEIEALWHMVRKLAAKARASR